MVEFFLQFHFNCHLWFNDVCYRNNGRNCQNQTLFKRTWPSLNGKSLEITRTVPLIWKFPSLFWNLNFMFLGSYICLREEIIPDRDLEISNHLYIIYGRATQHPSRGYMQEGAADLAPPLRDTLLANYEQKLVWDLKCIFSFIIILATLSSLQ